MDAVLINPGDHEGIFQSLGRDFAAYETPIWARMLASYLRAKGREVAIVDAEAEGLDGAATAGYVSAMNPRLCVVVVHGHQPSASTQKMPAAIAAVKAIKAAMPNMPVLVTGGHPAALPRRTLRETGADFVCTGEGFVTIKRLLERMGESNIWRDTYWLLVVPGLCYRDPRTLKPLFTHSATNIELDEVLGGCWDMLPMRKYRSYAHHAWSNGFQRQPYASIYTSLNCPFACQFCMISSPFSRGDEGKNTYRMWPADHVMAEITELVENYGVTNIRVDDEMFVLNRSHVFSICDKITERYGDRLNLWCYGRVDCTKPEFLGRMRAAGFKWLCLGIEAVSDAVRDGVHKGDYGEADIYKTVKAVQTAGINVLGNYMFGLPGDTINSMRATLDMALSLKTEYVNFYSTVAFPGSKLYSDLRAKGHKFPQDWLAWSFHSKEHEPLGTETLTPAEVLKFRDEAFAAYFGNSAYQAMVLRKFGLSAKEEIDDMLTHKLERDLLRQ